MTINYTAAAVGIIFPLLCAISAVTEKFPAKNAKIRKFFRFIKINLREIPVPIIIAAAALPIVCTVIFEKPDTVWAIVAAAAFVISAAVLDGFRIFGRLNSLKRRKKRRRAKWIRRSQ